jgi:hypothetical protein
MSTKRMKSRWVFAAPVTVLDERVNPENPEYGKRTRSVLFGIDSRGALWAEIDTANPVFIGMPPELPPKA